MTRTKKPTVVITGADHPTGLGIARSLAKIKCNIIGVYSHDDPCCLSKYWDRLIHIENYADIVNVLISIGKEYNETIVLFMAQDNVVKLVSNAREQLQDFYLFYLPPKNIVDIFLDKARFHAWALENGFNVPVSYICTSHQELQVCLENIPYPVILKPFEKTERWEILSPLNKTFKLNNKDDLKQIRFDIFEAAPKIIVQQWIPGGDNTIFFSLVYFNRCSNQVAYYTGRKLFQWPPLCGSTAAAIGEHCSEACDVTEQLFSIAGFQGLGSMEFKRSSLDGKFYIIEPTIGRCDLQSNIALAGGVNLPALALADACGAIAPAMKLRKATWINEEGLLDSVRVYLDKGHLSKHDLFLLLRPHIACAYFALSDPRPAWYIIRQKLVKLKIIGKINKALKLLVHGEYRLLLFRLLSFIPPHLFCYDNFFFVYCESNSVQKLIRPLPPKYSIIIHDFNYNLLERIKQQLPHNLDTVYYRLPQHEEKTKVITIEYKNTIIALQFILFDAKVPSPSHYNLKIDKNVVTGYGIFIHPDHRNKGLFYHLFNSAFDLSTRFGSPGIYAEIHSLNRISILAHKRMGFKLYKNIHYIELFRKRIFFESSKSKLFN